jgi:hypothetical protein
VTCWLLIDTIAMIGSPASRGAVASVGGAGRAACLAAASVLSAVSTTMAASGTMEGGPHRRIVTVDCAVVNRFAIPCPGVRASVPNLKFVSSYGPILRASESKGH